MVGSGHPAHDTRAARPDLARDAMGNAARSRAGSPTRVWPLVSKARAHLQPCPRPPPPSTLVLADFRRLTGSPRRAETLSRRAQPPLARRLPTALTCKAKLRQCHTPFLQTMSAETALGYWGDRYLWPPNTLRGDGAIPGRT